MMEFSRYGCTTQQQQRTKPCQCVSRQPWAYHGLLLHGKMQPMQCAAGVVKHALEKTAAGLGRWFVGGAVVLLNAGVLQMWRRRPATTAHRALSVCEWPALGIPWGTARSNAASTVCSRRSAACTGCCGRAGQVVYMGDCGFAEYWSVPEDVEVPLGNHSAQSPASLCLASLGYGMGHYQDKCSLRSVQQVWWSLHWFLRLGWAGGLWEMRFC